MTTQRDRLIGWMSRSILWGQAEQYRRDAARALAVRVVDDLLIASAEGKAIERTLRDERLAKGDTE